MDSDLKPLPNFETYEKEFKYMPWGILIKEIISIVKKKSPANAEILDLMCGPGYLLGKIKESRKDLKLEGYDINKDFITHATKKYSDIRFFVKNVLDWQPARKYDLILCTGSIHHIPYNKQQEFIEKISRSLKKGGFCILADPYIGKYNNEKERKISASELGYNYLISTITNGADNKIIKAAIDILYNDIMGFEFKKSLSRLKPVFCKYFSNVNIQKTWPEKNSEYGDYIFVLSND